MCMCADLMHGSVCNRDHGLPTKITQLQWYHDSRSENTGVYVSSTNTKNFKFLFYKVLYCFSQKYEFRV
jgi:hypothetical protein